MTIQKKKRIGENLMGAERYVTELVDVLKMEVRSFNAVIELLILEEKSLVASDTASLSEVIDRQGDILSSIACLEKSRIALLEKIARETRRNIVDLTLSELVKLVDGSLRKDLLETGNVLSYIYEDMKRKKISNTLLIRQGILMVESDIRLILRAIGKERSKPAVYAPGPDSGWMTGGIRIDGAL